MFCHSITYNRLVVFVGGRFMSIREDVTRMKSVAAELASSSIELRNKALKMVAENLRKNADKIFKANEIDIANAYANGVQESVLKRLKFDNHKLEDVIDGINQLIGLEDPVGKVTLNRELDEGLILKRVTCPIGIIGVIFEARPDALVQIASLCIKSGNCAILKGGKETAESNRCLFGVIREAIVEAGLPEICLIQAEAHSEIDELLKCDGLVDLLIPRGSNAFVQYIMNNTKIPVMGHADGICHIFIDKDADLAKAIPIVVDAKTQYSAACNAVETVLVHSEIAAKALPVLVRALNEANVVVNADAYTTNVYNAYKEDSDAEVHVIEDDAYNVEYLRYELGIKIVENVDEAIAHINKFGSHHTDSIITENQATADKFQNMVDSAGVYHNVSTRFADGFRYGFGAEVGISTSKIHARGPVGLEGLVTYKYKLTGNGQIVTDYASGIKTFKHRDLD